jgi:hypothetical protein
VSGFEPADPEYQLSLWGNKFRTYHTIKWPGQRSRYSDSLLLAEESVVRMPMKAKYTGPEVHPASCTMGTGSSFPGVKRPERSVDHPPPSRDQVKESVKLYLQLAPVPTWHVTGQPLPHSNVNFCSNNIYEVCLVSPWNSPGHS